MGTVHGRDVAEVEAAMRKHSDDPEKENMTNIH